MRKQIALEEAIRRVGAERISRAAKRHRSSQMPQLDSTKEDAKLVMTKHQPASGETVTILATCPECGAGVRISSEHIKVDGCELLTECVPLSCIHLSPVISAAQQILAKTVIVRV
jgi:hypothetical protein